MGVYLTKPNKTKEGEHGDAEGLSWGACAMQGWRVNMEDAHVAKTDLTPGVHLFGVFDGHGGQEVAKFCGAHFAAQLKSNEAFLAGKYKEALEQTFLKMDQVILLPDGQELLKTMKSEPDMTGSYAGCTANVCLITPTEIYCANAGDSRAILFSDDDQILPLSKDHKPDLDIEKARIQAAGGYVREGRINDNLNLSRAIGDFEYKKNGDLPPEKQIITAFPDVQSVPRNDKQRLLIMGCDGIWETLSAKDICEKVKKGLAKETDDAKKKDADEEKKKGPLIPVMESLLDDLIARDTSDGTGCDNMTSIIVHFK